MQPLDLQTLRERYGEQIKALAAKHKLENVRVFGSVARGEATEYSDLDILVHPMPRCSLFELMDFEEDMANLLGTTRVDVVTDDGIHRLLAPYILSEAQPL